MSENIGDQSPKEILQLTAEDIETISSLTKLEKKQLESMNQQEKKRFLAQRAKQIEQ